MGVLLTATMRHRLHFRQLPNNTACCLPMDAANAQIIRNILKSINNIKFLLATPSALMQIILDEHICSISSVTGCGKPPSQPSGVQRGEPGSRKTCVRLNFLAAQWCVFRICKPCSFGAFILQTRQLNPAISGDPRAMARQFIYHMSDLTKAYNGKKVIEKP
jgi:hypothetical protein